MTFASQFMPDLPGPTSLYLAFYLLTFVVHFVFVSYVVAGTLYLATTTFRRHDAGLPAPFVDPIRDVLRDWMPAALSVAITAGVAPLLFLQILYKRPFYTANLLLFHRWMAIVPVLIVAFYMSYLLKTRPSQRWHAWPTRVFALLACICLLFTGYSWSKNHLVSLDQESWPRIYALGSMWPTTRGILPRVALWIAVMFPGMATIVALQLWRSISEKSIQRLSRIVLVALAASFGAMIWNLATNQHLRLISAGAPWRTWAILAVAGIVIQMIAWQQMNSRGLISKSLLTIASAGLLATLSGLACLREAIRINNSQIHAYFDEHEQAARVGGLSVFVICVLVNAALIALCIRIVRRRKPNTVSTSPH